MNGDIAGLPPLATRERPSTLLGPESSKVRASAGAIKRVVRQYPRIQREGMGLRTPRQPWDRPDPRDNARPVGGQTATGVSVGVAGGGQANTSGINAGRVDYRSPASPTASRVGTGHGRSLVQYWRDQGGAGCERRDWKQRWPECWRRRPWHRCRKPQQRGHRHRDRGSQGVGSAPTQEVTVQTPVA